MTTALTPAVEPDHAARSVPTGCLFVASRSQASGGVAGESGDWTDLLPLPGGDLALVVGDARGRGASAAPLRRTLETILRHEALRGASPARILARMQSAVEPVEDALATLVYVVVGRAPGRVALFNIGHPPPLLLRSDGSARFIRTSLTPPLGAPWMGQVPRATETQLQWGDTLVLYTDGVIERPGCDLHEGMARLSARACGVARAAVDDLCRVVVQLGLDCGGRNDDLTALAVRFSAGAVPPIQDSPD